MKRYKSRTLIGRTISKVKSRITSFGSPVDTESPNPLIAPPVSYKTIASPSRTSRAYRTVPQRSPTHDTIREPKPPKSVLKETTLHNLDGTSDDPPHTSIAAPTIKTTTWTVFGTHPQYPATAYVNLEVLCGSGEASKSAAPITPDQPPTRSLLGYLYDLSLTSNVVGPGVIIKGYGHSTRTTIRAGEKWTIVLHVGLQETSLASRLSTSFKSLGGRLGKISNTHVINRWLEVLQRDTVLQSGGNESALKVQLRIIFKHSLLPTTTTLVEERVVNVVMTEDDVERAKMEDDILSNKSEAEDEERIQESRVMGAPWL